MRVQEFIDNINKQVLDGDLQCVRYIPYEEKKQIVDAIMFDCLQEFGGYYTTDSLLMDQLFIKYMINSHTNLDYDEKDYDLLREYFVGEDSLLKFVMDQFKSDYVETYQLLLKRISDFKSNNSPLNSLAKILFSLEDSILKASEEIEDKINKDNIKEFFPNGITEDGIVKFLSKCGDV